MRLTEMVKLSIHILLLIGVYHFMLLTSHYIKVCLGLTDIVNCCLLAT